MVRSCWVISRALEVHSNLFKMKKVHVYLLSTITVHNIMTCVSQLHENAEIWRRERLPAVISYTGIEKTFQDMYNASKSTFLVNFQDSPRKYDEKPL